MKPPTERIRARTPKALAKQLGIRRKRHPTLYSACQRLYSKKGVRPHGIDPLMLTVQLTHIPALSIACLSLPHPKRTKRIQLSHEPETDCLTRILRTESESLDRIFPDSSRVIQKLADHYCRNTTPYSDKGTKIWKEFVRGDLHYAMTSSLQGWTRIEREHVAAIGLAKAEIEEMISYPGSNQQRIYTDILNEFFANFNGSSERYFPRQPQQPERPRQSLPTGRERRDNGHNRDLRLLKKYLHALNLEDL